MNRISAFIVVIAVVMLACIAGESKAGLFQRFFGSGGGACVGGMCVAAPEGVSEVGSFSAEVEGFGLFGRPRRARMSSVYGAPQVMSSYGTPMSFSTPMTAGAGGGGCYSSSYAPASQSYATMSPSFSSAPMTAGAGSCYSASYAPTSQVYQVPRYQVAPPRSQTAPTIQDQLAPQLQPKDLPSQEYAPSPSKSTQKRAMATNEVRYSIRRIQPRIGAPERRPTATIGCSGKCCGGVGDCECGENCGCGSPPGTPVQKKERTRLVGIDYSDMSVISRMVDYTSLSETGDKVAKR